MFLIKFYSFLILIVPKVLAMSIPNTTTAPLQLPPPVLHTLNLLNHHHHSRFTPSSVPNTPKSQIPLKINESYTTSESEATRTKIWGYANTWVDLKCENSDPNINTSITNWTKNGDCDFLNNQTQSDSYNITEDTSSYILRVKVTPTTIGNYTCYQEPLENNATIRTPPTFKNFTLALAAKPLIPEFQFSVIPKTGILVEVTGHHALHRKTFHILKGKGNFTDEIKDDLGDNLPLTGYIIQMRKMGSCDDWRNITGHSERKFIGHHHHPLVSGTTYRMRIASRTLAGVGEFSRAKSVPYTHIDDNDLGDDI